MREITEISIIPNFGLPANGGLTPQFNGNGLADNPAAHQRD